MARTIFTNVSIFDGTGSPSFPGEVLVDGNRIKTVAHGHNQLDPNGAEVVDAGGATLMPGMVESHGHLQFGSTLDRIERNRDFSPEKMQMVAIHAAKVLMDYGMTSCFSGGARNTPAEVAIREEINGGWLPGPRLKACSFEMIAGEAPHTPGTARQRNYRGIDNREPEDSKCRQFVKEMAKLGVDSVKFLISGESANTPGSSRQVQFYESEIQAAAEEARANNLWTVAHCHAAESVKIACRAGFNVLYHCTWADEEGIDMIEARKKEVFVGPAPGINWANMYEAEEFGVTREAAEKREQFITFDLVCKVMPELLKRGVRVVPGGDYGFPMNPNGKNMRDLELFVNHFGFTPAQALMSATKWGGEIMNMGDELGLIKDGYLADILLIDGDPLKNIKLVQDKNKILMVMKDGKYHKAPAFNQNQQQRVAAE